MWCRALSLVQVARQIIGTLSWEITVRVVLMLLSRLCRRTLTSIRLGRTRLVRVTVLLFEVITPGILQFRLTRTSRRLTVMTTLLLITSICPPTVGPVTDGRRRDVGEILAGTLRSGVWVGGRFGYRPVGRDRVLVVTLVMIGP